MVVRLDMIKMCNSTQIAPVASVSVVNESGRRSARFQARIDTGADITCVPAQCASELWLPEHEVVRYLISDGRHVVAKTRRAAIEIWAEDERFCLLEPEYGLLLWEQAFGLLAMDVLNKMAVRGCREKWELSWPIEEELKCRS